MKNLKLPKIKMPIGLDEFMILVAICLIGAGVNEMFGRGPAMLSCGCLILALSLISLRGQPKGGV